MLRNIKNATNQQIIKLFQNINLGIESMLKDYSFLYVEKEKKKLYQATKIIEKFIKKLEVNAFSLEDKNKILEIERYLKPFAFRCWNFEVESGGGYQFISWFKNDILGPMPKVISTTFFKEGEETFCGSRYGIAYEISIDGFLGACNKDAATLIEEETKVSLYTIGITEDGKVINSYNLATPIITPTQVLNKETNIYKSNHNEIILDARYIKPISVICKDENDLEIVSAISQKYKIPIDLRVENMKNNL